MAKAKKLPSGKWRVQASITVNGKQVRKSFTADNPKRAEQLAINWQNKEDYNYNDMTLSQAFERYISAKENILSPGTIRLYKTLSKNHLLDLLQIKITNLNSEIIQRAINVEAASSSPKTIRNIHGLLSATLKMFRPNFVLTTTLPQKKPTNLYIPDDNDIKRLMLAVKNTDMEIPVLLAAFGPMRRGEICALTSDDIKGNVISVNKSVVRNSEGITVVKSPKTVSSYREIPFPDFVIEKLQGISGKIVKISPEHITRRFAKVLKRNNITQFRFHDLRHYNVSILHAMNVPDKYIMARGGWRTNYTMNNVYNHTLKNKSDEFNNIIYNHFTDVYGSKQ